MHKPGFSRKVFDHKFIDFYPLVGHYVHDDEVHINTQSGSQWDGFKVCMRHVEVLTIR